MSIVVYSKPACVQCRATYRELAKYELEFQTIDVTKDLEALAFIESLGYLSAPVVVTDDDHWSGFRPDRVKALAST